MNLPPDLGEVTTWPSVVALCILVIHRVAIAVIHRLATGACEARIRPVTCEDGASPAEDGVVAGDAPDTV